VATISVTFLRTKLYACKNTFSLTFPIFPDFSLTTLKFPDFSRFSRWVATLSNHLIATRPGVELTTSWSWVKRPNHYRDASPVMIQGWWVTHHCECQRDDRLLSSSSSDGCLSTVEETRQLHHRRDQQCTQDPLARYHWSCRSNPSRHRDSHCSIRSHLHSLISQL